MKVNTWANQPPYRDPQVLKSTFDERAPTIEPATGRDPDTPQQHSGETGADAQSQARSEAKPVMAEPTMPASEAATVPASTPPPALPNVVLPVRLALREPGEPGEPLDLTDRIDFERGPSRSTPRLLQSIPNPASAGLVPAPLPASTSLASITAPPAAANERPAEPAWLAQRERALVAFRADYEAARAQAAAGGVGFGRIGAGWVVAVLSTDESGQVQRTAGQIEVFDPTAEPVPVGWDESGPLFTRASQTYEFDETAFAADYRARGATQPGGSLQALAAAYNTDGATLFAQRPELWALATGDHAINAGSALAGFAMGDARQLAMTDLYLADPQIAALIQTYGGTPEPARSGIALEQARLYGERRYAQLSRLGTAMASVREQYTAALTGAQAGRSAAGWV